ncbi:hypothetical protein SAMN06296386_10438 [Lachnospiraceae bacterium]|nr:hypothetical protein SAMN06296386_10438 [Lachnospiraceae bacterium]
MVVTLNENLDKSVTETLPVMSESIKWFKGEAEQFDDITMIGFEFKKPLN